MAAPSVNRYIFKRHLLKVNLFDRTYARARGAADDALAARCGLGGGVRQHSGSTTALKGRLTPVPRLYPITRAREGRAGGDDDGDGRARRGVGEMKKTVKSVYPAESAL
jgi:hypothetical protein